MQKCSQIRRARPFGVHLFPCLVRLRSSHLPFSADSHRPNLYRFAVNRGWFAAGVSQCERNSASSTALCVCVRQQHKQGGANATVARIHAGIGAGGAQPRPRVPLPTCPLDRPPSSVVGFKPTIISLEPYVAEIMHTVTAEGRIGREEGGNKRLCRYQPCFSRSPW